MFLFILMKAIAICIEGLEEITILEIKEILKIKSDIIMPSRVIFEVKKEEDIAEFAYKTRSATKVYFLVDNFKFENMKDITEKAKVLNFPFLSDTFAVRCNRLGLHDFSSQDIEKEVGGVIFNNNKIKVDLVEPTTTILLDILDNHCFFGIDFCGEKLSKRNYRIKNISNPTNPCLAYSLVRLSTYKSTDFLLDVFCKSAEIPIEAALFSLNIPNGERILDKLLFAKLLNKKFKIKTIKEKLNIIATDISQNNLRAGEINSKIAGVNKFIKFSRMDIDWLDTKFKENSIDKIISVMPSPTHLYPLKDVEKVYKEFFYQIKFILKNNGIATIATTVPEIAERYYEEFKFKKLKELNFKYTNQKWTVIILAKSFYLNP